MGANLGGVSLVLCRDPEGGSCTHRELRVREAPDGGGGYEVFMPCSFGEGMISGGDIRGHWFAPAPATLKSKAELVLIARPHSWPGRFAALLAKSRWVEREAVRYQQTIADDETARLALAGIDLATLDEPSA